MALRLELAPASPGSCPFCRGASTSLMIAWYGTFSPERACSMTDAGFAAGRTDRPSRSAGCRTLLNPGVISPRSVIGTNTCGRDPSRRAVEAARRDPHDRQRLSVDDQRLVETRGLAPNRVLQYAWLSTTTGDWPIAASSPLTDEPPERGVQLEHLKIAARHHHAFAVRRFAVEREIRIEHAMRGDAGQDRLVLVPDPGTSDS